MLQEGRGKKRAVARTGLSIVLFFAAYLCSYVCKHTLQNECAALGKVLVPRVYNVRDYIQKLFVK